MANNDSVLIPYVIQEGSFWYVAYKEKAPVPEIVVSSKGVANGLSEEYNDGWDFGPDSYSPTSTSAIPYTRTCGIQEAILYAMSNNIGTIRLRAGVYDMTNAPFQSYTNNAGSAYAKILIPSKDGETNPSIPIRIIGEDINLQNYSEIVNAPLSDYGVLLYDATAGSSTQSYILGVAGQTSTPTNITIEIDRIAVRVAAGNGIGGLDLKSANTGTIGTIFLGVNESWPLTEPTNTTQVGINLPGHFTSGCTVEKIISYGGLYNTISLGHHPIIFRFVVFGDLNSIYIDNEIHEGLIVSADIEYVQNIFNVSSSYAGSGVISPLKIVEMSVANNNSYSSGATWQNPVSFVNNPSAIQIFPILIEDLWYYGGIVPDSYYPTQNFLYIKRIIYSNTIVNSTVTSGYAVPTLSANPPVSATVYQNTNPYDIEIDLPVYATTAGTAGYVTVAKGSTDTPTAIANQYVSGSTSDTSEQIIRLRVPAGWYYSFTASGVKFTTATAFAE